LRLEPLTTYFFGVSPVGDESFFENKEVSNPPHAMSLRMSDLGYSNSGRCHYGISYNDMNSYITGFEKILNESCPLFEKIGVNDKNKHKQLNTNILQIEAEYYNTVRPKGRTIEGERPIKTLKRDGISYVEFRGIDINPLNKVGIEKEDIYFLHLLFLHSLFAESPPISEEEMKEISDNQRKIAKEGRKENIIISKDFKKIDFKDYIMEVLDQIERISHVLKKHSDYKKYIDVINRKRNMVKDINLTPSGKCVERARSKKSSYLNCIIEASELNKKYFENIELDPGKLSRFDNLVKESIRQQVELECQNISLNDYMSEYFKK
jgi:glutamate--cysteine ligase